LVFILPKKMREAMYHHTESNLVAVLTFIYNMFYPMSVRSVCQLTLNNYIPPVTAAVVLAVLSFVEVTLNYFNNTSIPSFLLSLGCGTALDLKYVSQRCTPLLSIMSSLRKITGYLTDHSIIEGCLFTPIVEEIAKRLIVYKNIPIGTLIIVYTETVANLMNQTPISNVVLAGLMHFVLTACSFKTAVLSHALWNFLALTK